MYVWLTSNNHGFSKWFWLLTFLYAAVRESFFIEYSQPTEHRKKPVWYFICWSASMFKLSCYLRCMIHIAMVSQDSVVPIHVAESRAWDVQLGKFLLIILLSYLVSQNIVMDGEAYWLPNFWTKKWLGLTQLTAFYTEVPIFKPRPHWATRCALWCRWTCWKQCPRWARQNVCGRKLPELVAQFVAQCG